MILKRIFIQNKIRITVKGLPSLSIVAKSADIKAYSYPPRISRISVRRRLVPSWLSPSITYRTIYGFSCCAVFEYVCRAARDSWNSESAIRREERAPSCTEIPADPSLTETHAADAMTGFTESALVKRLMDLNPSQQSIQTLSLWLIHHRKHHPTIVKIWFKEMCKGNDYSVAIFFPTSGSKRPMYSSSTRWQDVSSDRMRSPRFIEVSRLYQIAPCIQRELIASSRSLENYLYQYRIAFDE